MLYRTSYFSAWLRAPASGGMSAEVRSLALAATAALVTFCIASEYSRLLTADYPARRSRNRIKRTNLRPRMARITRIECRPYPCRSVYRAKRQDCQSVVDRFGRKLDRMLAGKQ